MGFWDIFNDNSGIGGFKGASKSGSSSIIRNVIDIEKNEKRKQAREYVKRAKEIVRDAEERYNNTYANTVSYAYKTQQKLEEHNEFKKRLIRDIDVEFKPIIDKFEKFDIDSKIFNMEFVSVNSNNFSFNSYSTSSIFSSFENKMSLSSVIGPNFSSIFSLFDNSEEEYWEAKRQLDEAKRYKLEIEYQREKLRTMKSNLSDIQSYIYDEKQMLDNLKSKIKKITSTLENEMKRTSFTKEESDKLKSMHKIAKGISKLMSIKFLNDDFSITNEYRKTYENISNINNMLPNTPNINNNTWREITRMLDSVVVY